MHNRYTESESISGNIEVGTQYSIQTITIELYIIYVLYGLIFIYYSKYVIYLTSFLCTM